MFDLERMSPRELGVRLMMGLSVTITDKEKNTRVRIGRGPGPRYTVSTHLGDAWRVDRSNISIHEAIEVLSDIVIRNQEADEAAKHS